MLSGHLRVLYLHGFASSPASRKAQFFTEKLQGLGYPIDVLDLAEGDFEHLTITGQLRVVERAARGEPVALIGSSLGGYLAALYAARHPEVDRLILMAPAFQFQELWAKQLPLDDYLLWKERGTMPVFHYAEQREVPIGYGLMEDAGKYEAFPEFSQPALLFHGTQDSVVPIRLSSAFAASHPNVRLIPVNSGHELTDALDQIWRESCSFLTTARQSGYEKP